VIELQVAALDGKNVVDLAHVYTRKRLPLSLQNVATIDDVSKWAHLHDIELSDVSGQKIMMLIGQDAPEALAYLDIRRGGEANRMRLRHHLGGQLMVRKKIRYNKLLTNVTSVSFRVVIPGAGWGLGRGGSAPLICSSPVWGLGQIFYMGQNVRPGALSPPPGECLNETLNVTLNVTTYFFFFVGGEEWPAYNSP
jgi:hypothetical protein